MALKEYLNSLTVKEAESLAARCNTSFAYLKQIAYGHRRCREALAIRLEKESGKKITCEQLRPDVDWAYLRSSQTAA